MVTGKNEIKCILITALTGIFPNVTTETIETFR